MLRSARKGRKRLFVAACALVAVVGAVSWRAFGVSELLHMGTGYSAQQTCACLWVSRRSLASCMSDLDPLARRLTSLRVGTDEVTARALAGIDSATARFEKGFGCSLRD